LGAKYTATVGGTEELKNDQQTAIYQS
jgi:hypothetical protein